MIISVLFPLILGAVTLQCILLCTRIPLLLFASFSYLLGMGIVTKGMLLLDLFNCQLTLMNCILLLSVYCVIVTVGVLVFGKAAIKKEELFNKSPRKIFSEFKRIFLIIFILYIMYSILYICWTAYNSPIVEIDAVRVHAIKAKTIFIDHNFLNIKQGLSPTYPPQIPLSLAWGAFCVNQWQEGWIKLYFPLSFIAFMSVFYYCIKTWTDKFWALLGLVLLLASPLWLANGWLVHADMITAIYTVMTIMLLTIALKKERINLVVLASLFASIAAFSKRAGAAYFIIELLMLIVGGCLLRLKNPRFLRNAIIAFTVPMIVWSLPFIIFKFNLTSQGHAGDMLWAVGVDYGHRLLVVLLVVVKQLFLSNDWNFLWLLLTLSLLGVIVKRSFEIVFITLLLTGFFIAYILLSVLTTTYYNGLMGDINPYILPRVIIHFFPLCPLLIILCLHQTFEGFKE